MINNMMMGGGVGGGNDIFDLMQHLQPRPRVANQQNVDALPTDTYRVQTKPNKNKDADENVDIDLSVDEEEKKDHEEDGDDGDKDKETCSICLEPFKDGDTIKRLPCLHIFHQHEIDRWLLTGADKCPICRMPINGQQNQ